MCILGLLHDAKWSSQMVFEQIIFLTPFSNDSFHVLQFYITVLPKKSFSRKYSRTRGTYKLVIDSLHMSKLSSNEVGHKIQQAERN